MIFEAEVESAHYGNVIALQRMSLKAEAGRTVGILGANGAGKTTSLLSIMGTVASKFRKLILDGMDLSGVPTWKLAREGIGFCPDGAWCFSDLTVMENLQSVYDVCAKKRATAAKNPMEEVFQLFPVLEERKSQFAGTLSGGEKKMLAIARVLMIKPKVMILDEPSSGLAPKLVGELYRSIAKIKKTANAAIILAEQNAKICLKISDYCFVLEQGKVVLEGSASNLYDDEKIREAYLGV